MCGGRSTATTGTGESSGPQRTVNAMPAAVAIADAVLAAGAAARLTRFVVVEDLGGWLIREPAQRWADRPCPACQGPTTRETVNMVCQTCGRDYLQDHPTSRRHKLVSGLDCPFCVGTWLHIAAQASTALLPASGRLRSVWRVVAAGLTASYLLAHLGAVWGDVADDYDADSN